VSTAYACMAGATACISGRSPASARGESKSSIPRTSGPAASSSPSCGRASLALRGHPDLREHLVPNPGVDAPSRVTSATNWRMARRARCPLRLPRLSRMTIRMAGSLRRSPRPRCCRRPVAACRPTGGGNATRSAFADRYTHSNVNGDAEVRVGILAAWPRLRLPVLWFRPPENPYCRNDQERHGQGLPRESRTTRLSWAAREDHTGARPRNSGHVRDGPLRRKHHSR
jgi:hypothetical protein